MKRFNEALKINKTYEIALYNKILVMKTLSKFSEAALELFFSNFNVSDFHFRIDKLI